MSLLVWVSSLLLILSDDLLLVEVLGREHQIDSEVVHGFAWLELVQLVLGQIDFEVFLVL